MIFTQRRPDDTTETRMHTPYRLEGAGPVLAVCPTTGKLLGRFLTRQQAEIHMATRTQPA